MSIQVNKIKFKIQSGLGQSGENNSQNKKDSLRAN